MPPVIAISEPAAKQYATIEDITVNFTAYDEKSGIALTPASVNGILVENGQLVDLASLKTGENTLTVTAIDGAGNSAAQSVTFTIAPTPVTIKVTPVAKNVKEDNNFDFMVHVSSEYNLSSLSSAATATFEQGYTTVAVLYKEGNIKVDVGVLESREYTFTLTSIGGVKVISNTVNVSVFVPGEKGNSTKTALKLNKHLQKEGNQAKIIIDLFTTSNSQVDAVLVEEYIPNGLGVDTRTGIFTGYGLLWDVGRVEQGDKQSVEYTLRILVETPTTYMLRTVVEYQTAEDLEMLEEITYLTVEPNGQLRLKEGQSKGEVKEKGKGYTKEERGRGYSKSSSGGGGDRGKSEEHRQDDKAHEKEKGKPDSPPRKDKK